MGFPIVPYDFNVQLYIKRTCNINYELLETANILNSTIECDQFQPCKQINELSTLLLTLITHNLRSDNEMMTQVSSDRQE